MPCWCLSKANAPPAGGSTTSDYEASGEPASALKKKLTDAGVDQSEIEPPSTRATTSARHWWTYALVDQMRE